MTTPEESTLDRTRDVKGFKEIWLAQAFSLFGHQITLLAIPTLAILTLGASDSEVGLLRALESVFFPFLAVWVGVWADRIDPRRLLIAADILRLGALISIPVAAFFNALTLAQLYIVAALVGIGWVLFNVPFMAYIPKIVPLSLLGRANSRLSVPQSVAEVTGPGMSAVLIRILGAANALLLDIFTYAISVVLLLRAPPRPRVTTEPPRIREDLAVGFRVVLHSPILRAIVFAGSMVNFGYGLVSTVLILFAYRELGMGPTEYGIALSVGSAGAVLGSLWANMANERLGFSRALALSSLTFTTGFAGLTLAGATLTTWTAGVAIAAAWFLVAVAMPIFDVAQVTIRQTVTPHELHGRVNAVLRTIIWGALSAGVAISGWVAELISYQGALLAAAAFAALALWPVTFGALRRIRTGDDLVTEAEKNMRCSRKTTDKAGQAENRTEDR